MTEATDIAALRKLALKATQGEWRAFTDVKSRTCAIHTPEDKGCNDIIDWMGFDGASGSRKQKVDNAKYIAAANPATILSLLDRLEAERQRADERAKENYGNKCKVENCMSTIADLEAELTELKAKLANPVVLPSLNEERFQRYDEWHDITTFDELIYKAEVISEIRAAGFTTVKGE